ncbi:hypothetical protein BGZ63DRAFT_372968 [Mariannaea sp. PMI_226]|nr:hypothetical protein BGZ63DRAFT_372968 [Mariannaea sp. PMI_226]
MGTPGQPRRGRPPVETAPEEPETELGTRRTRMRLAQRAYRTRKTMAFDREKERSERLANALQRTIGAFAAFQHRVILQGQSSPELLAHLDKVAGEMATAVQNVRDDLPSQTPLVTASSLEASQGLQGHWQPEPAVSTSGHSRPGSQPKQLYDSQHSMVSVLPQTRNPNKGSFEARFFSACIQRTIVLLFNDGYHHQDWLPALSVPLKLLGLELLRSSTIDNLSSFGFDIKECHFPPIAVANLPTMFRVVAGDSKLEPRLKAPFVQRFQFGKTRTKLRTDDPVLQGEWLEAADVEEYLQERGIDIRHIGTSTTVGMDTRDQSSSGWQIVTTRKSGGDDIMTMTPDLAHLEKVDNSVFGLRSDTRTLVPGVAYPRGVLSSNMMTALGPEVENYYSQNASPMRIIIDIDELIQTLGAHAVCLGNIPGIRSESVDYAIQRSITKLENIGQAAMT